MVDSVNLINGGKPDWMNDVQWVDCVERNKEHLRVILAYDCWTDEDLTVFKKVI